jgi:septum formation topological specificity factor MinE
MGLLDRFKGRRDEEDALAQARRTQDAAPAPIVSESGESIGTPVNAMGLSAGEMPTGWSAGQQVGGLENLGAIGAAIQQAMATGNFQVVQAEAQQMQQQAQGMREDMMAVYAKHGVDMTGGTTPQVDNPQQLQQDLLEVMKKHGMDPGSGAFTFFGMSGGQAGQVGQADPGSVMKVEPGTPGEPEAS